MLKKILTGLLIGISSLLLILSVLGIGLVWVYNEPLTQASTARLKEIDTELMQVQTSLQSAKMEVERALRIIESIEKSMSSLSNKTTDIQSFLEEINSTLDDKLIPGLKTTREKIVQVRGTVESIRSALENINALPFGLNLPGDQMLSDILGEVDSMDKQVADVQDLAQRASTFMNDTSFAVGGDFNETKQHLQDLLQVLNDYEQKVTSWRSQVQMLLVSVPRWIDNASIILTIFLLWFGFSQFGLMLHGLSIQRGEDPLKVIRRRPPQIDSSEE